MPRPTDLLVLGLLLALASPARAEEPYFAPEVGFDGVAVRGGVVPLRMTLRVPPGPDPADPWRIRVRPRGGPFDWVVVFPVRVAPGESRVIDAALPVHPEVETLDVLLEDPAGRARLQRVLRPAWVPDRAPLGLFVSYERGLRRHGEPGRGESLWIRLPVDRLPLTLGGFLDVDGIAGVDPEAGSARLRHVVTHWRAGLGGRVWSTPPSAWSPAPRLDFEDLRELAPSPRDGRAWPGRLGVLALVVALAVVPVRRARPAALVAVAILGLWIAGGAPTRVSARLDGILLGFETRAEAPGVQWDLRTFAPGWGSTPRTDWPLDVELVAPAWLAPSSRPWEVWQWNPGTGEPRVEVRAPARAASGRWIGWGRAHSVPPRGPRLETPPTPWRPESVSLAWEDAGVPRFRLDWPRTP